MRRWGVALAVVVAFCAFVFAHRSHNPALLKDTDTAVLLQTLEQRNAPLSWFAGDWPLGNHFYRPISTLTFELDHRLHGRRPSGYAETNALLAVACILLLFWLVRELTDSPATAGFAGALFAIWHIYPPWFASFLDLLQYAVIAVAFGAFFKGRRLLPNLIALLASSAAVGQLAGLDQDIGAGVMYWIPGRTASTMTIFALAAMAAYARYERCGAQRRAEVPSPRTPPPTKSSRQAKPAGKWNALWAVAACLFLALALGSYEQAVMLPGALVGVAVFFSMKRHRVRWGWQAAFWGVLFAYMALRFALVPTTVSGYQHQQFRSGPGVWISLADHVCPCLSYIPTVWHTIDFGWLLLFFPATYQILWLTLTNAAVAATACRRLPLFLVGWALSSLAFLPMAWMKPFHHYNYWPMALRSILAVALFQITGDLIVSAWSRPSLQAPPRPDPAPGSLPRQ